MVRLKGRGFPPEVFHSLFQFHYGTIKSLRKYFSEQLHRSFNSTMVRLKGTDNYGTAYFIEFQFHYGTIKRLPDHLLAVLLNVVSIPLWYD